jgi:2'-5' RNA ligase
METIRSFVAILLPDEIRQAAASLADSLRPLGRRVSWVKAENLHLTLKFLGNHSPEDLRRVTEGLAEATTGVAPFELLLTGLGAFPDLRRPRVIWVGATDGAQAAIALALRVEGSLHRRGLPKEERPFSPHLTIGRVKDPRGLHALSSAIADERARVMGRFQVSAIHLMRSDLSREGARYTILQVFPLSGSTGEGGPDLDRTARSE